MSEDTDTPSEQRETDATSIRRRSFVAGTSAVAAGGLAGLASAQEDDGDGQGQDDESDGGQGDGGERDMPDIIAHRGYAGLYPENTVAACAASSEGAQDDAAPSRAADMIEIDVMQTADEDVVVFHDDGLAERDGGERGLTDTSGLVWETPTDVVTSAEVLDSGETVPLLTEVFEAIPPRVGINIEMKHPGDPDLRFAENLEGDALDQQVEKWNDFVVDVLNVADQYNNEILVSSFYEAALTATREHSDYAVAPLLWDSISDGLDIAREYDAEAVHPPYNMIEGTPFFADDYYTEGPWEDVNLLQTAHDEGREVNVYTLTTWYEAEQLAAAGVDGLIADHSDLLRFGERQFNRR